MTRRRGSARHDPAADPFAERVVPIARGAMQLLGAQFHFQSNSDELLRLVDSAYGGVPPHRLSARVPRLRVRLILTSGANGNRRTEPPALTAFSGAGFLGGATPSSNFVAVCPKERAALVVVSPQMLRSAYHTRYELIEFAVYVLAARTQGLVALHAACVGHAGRGILLLGASGAGKSTVALHCLLQGFDFLSEDSVLMCRETMLATGVANFLHLRADALRWLVRTREAARVRRSPVIRRRSGVKKFELDLRLGEYRLARAPLKIAATVFLSAQQVGDRPQLRALSKAEFRARLNASQPYAASQPQWRRFGASLSSVEAFELTRGSHPLDTVDVLRTLVGFQGARRRVK